MSVSLSAFLGNVFLSDSAGADLEYWRLQQFSGSTTLVGAINSTVTSLVLSGSLLPNLTGILIDSEPMQITASSSSSGVNTYTVTRSAATNVNFSLLPNPPNVAAASHNDGATVQILLYANFSQIGAPLLNNMLTTLVIPALGPSGYTVGSVISTLNTAAATISSSTSFNTLIQAT